MVTKTSAWGDAADHVEATLLRAEMDAALRGEARVESFVIDHPSGFVAVKVRLPQGLSRAARSSRRDWVQDTLASVVEEAFTDEGLVLAPILVLA
jgi:hypothetical protein